MAVTKVKIKGVDGVTATTAEINLLDGAGSFVTADSNGQVGIGTNTQSSGIPWS